MTFLTRATRLAVMFTVMSSAQARPAEERNTLTADGERYHQDTIVFAAKDCSAFWFLDAANQGKSKSTRIRMAGQLKGAPVEFQLSVPTQATLTFDMAPGASDADNLAHWAFLDAADVNTYGDGMHATLRKVTVTISRYDAVGGLIEGRVDGVLFTTKNAPYREIEIHIAAKFSIKRGADVRVL